MFGRCAILNVQCHVAKAVCEVAHLNFFSVRLISRC